MTGYVEISNEMWANGYYEVLYSVPTASGGKHKKCVYGLSKKECEEFCDKCDKLGYEIHMVNGFGG